ncbi:hypothetical protein AX14_011686 [Amanita brunnescens Koide BX004]|nr:hypothetical protein AX14_011686 [Amanita brunnescens Koide BX004]
MAGKNVCTIRKYSSNGTHHSFKASSSYCQCDEWYCPRPIHDRQVIGWPINGGKNQEWIIEPAGDYHTIKNVHFRTYLGYTGQFRGASAIGVGSPTQWAITQDEEDPTAFRFIVPNHDLNLELTEHGSPVSGTPKRVPMHWPPTSHFSLIERFDAPLDSLIVIPVLFHWTSNIEHNQGSDALSAFTMAFQGTYTITNVESGTVLDQSGTDHVNITGWPANGGDNQQWDVQLVDNYENFYTIKNIQFGTYVGYEKPIRGVKVVGVEFPTPWELLQDEVDPSTYRFFIPKSDLDLEVSRHGSDKPGTPVVIASQTAETNQTWRLQRVETPEPLGKKKTPLIVKT